MGEHHRPVFPLNQYRRKAAALLGRDVRYAICSVPITLPPGHALPIYQRDFPQYDRYFLAALRKISQHCTLQRKQLLFIDLGANVGDTAVAVLETTTAHVVSVEGNPHFIRYLRHNLSRYDGRVTLIDHYISAAQTPSVYESNRSTGGFRPAEQGGVWDCAPSRDVAEIIENHPADVRIWKSDTDGLDVPILLGNWDLISNACKVIWFELDPRAPGVSSDQLDSLVSQLVESGRVLCIFDNTGRPMLRTSGPSGHGILRDMLAWIAGTPGSRVQVPYVDMWAIDKTLSFALDDMFLSSQVAKVSEANS